MEVAVSHSPDGTLPLARGGKKKGGNIKETYRRFFAYQWEELLCNIDFPASHQERQPSKETTSKGLKKQHYDWSNVEK